MLRLAICFCLFVAPASAATTAPPEPSIQDLVTTDVLGYACVMEDDLDAAFFNAGKGGSVPQTCITAAPEKDCATLTALLGHEATPTECATHAYRWLTWFDPDRSTGWGFDCGDCVVETYNPPAAVPLPGSVLALLTGLGLLALTQSRATKKDA